MSEKDVRAALDLMLGLENEEFPAIDGLVSAISCVAEVLPADDRANALFHLCAEIQRRVGLAKSSLADLRSVMSKSSQRSLSAA